MIYLLTLLCSMCIQFATVNPFNMAQFNSNNEFYIDTVKSQITGTKSRYWGSYSNFVNVPNDYWIVLKGFNSSGGDIVCLCPNEYLDSTKTTTITCDSYLTDSDDVVSSAKLKFNQYTVFPIANNTYWIENNANIYGWKTYNFLGDNWSLLYCKTPIYYQSTLIIDSSYQIPDISGHTQTGFNDYQDLQEPFSNIGFSGHSSVNSVDDSSSNNLLGNILNAIRGIGNLYVNGVNNIGHFIGGLWGNINNTINYVIEPIDKNVVNDYIQGSTMGTIFTMVGGVFGDIVLPEDPDDDIIFRWHFPSGFGDAQGSFNLSDALDGSKHIWQPLLLTCLYGSFAIGLFRSMPSMLSGSSGIVGTIFGNNSNDSKTKKGGN